MDAIATKTVKAELAQEGYANATRTAAEAMGANKQARNDESAADWLKMLTDLGIKPDGRPGLFNGPGSL
jgi:hypothetical protein